MNIVFFAKSFYPNIGGVEIHVLNLSKILIERGHNITIFTEDFEKNLNSSRENINPIKEINLIKINAGMNERKKKFKIWWQMFKHIKILKNADVVHCHDIFFWYLPFRFIFPLKKVFTTFHGYETKFPLTKKAIFVRKVSEILSFGNICIGGYIKKWYGTKPNYVLYGGVEKHLGSSQRGISPKTSKLKIVLIGRLENDIGVNKYLKSLDLLKKKKIKFQFESCGEGILKKDVIKYGKANGFVEDISTYISNSDIIFASSYLTILESLIRKKIIVSVFNNSLKEDYLKNSPFSQFIYICKNPTEISDVIEYNYKYPWKSESMIENGYKWVQKQTWEKVANAYIDLWKI